MASNEISIKRIYNAPVKAVWQAWVDPAQVGEWWGPRGFTLTTHKKDVRVGGNWVYTMHGPDGTDYPNRTLFHEVVENALLDYDHGANEEQPAMFRVKVKFTEVGGKTEMDMRMVLPTAEAAAQTRVFVKQANGESTWDRLGEYLDKRLHKKETFIINRSFEISIEKMFALWTDPSLQAQWVAPAGTTMEFLRGDIRAGSRTFYKMAGGDHVMYGSAEYLEITRPSRAVYIQQFRNAADEIARHPMAPTWPESMRTVLELTEEGSNATRVTLTWEPHGQVTAEELATFCAARAGMNQGWNGSLDNLEAYIARG
jgi:uncharacterized protein YndB with AHSA1/START domain